MSRAYVLPRSRAAWTQRLTRLSVASLVAASFVTWSAAADSLRDPYADAVAPATSSAIVDSHNAVGKPDRVYATLLAQVGHDLVLDMGAGEEGTGDLMVHYRRSASGAVTTLAFLDAAGNTLASKRVNFVGNRPGANMLPVKYDRAPMPYRFVRLTSTDSAILIDAVVARSYAPDSDGDGLPDSWEAANGLNPLDPHDALADSDGDGLTNAQEYAAGTDPRQADTDGDGLPDGWEVQQGLNPLDGSGSQGASGDPDGDGLSNAEEYGAGTNPLRADTDGDGLNDREEVQHGSSPLDGPTGDPDRDGLTNGQEAALGTNPLLADTDGDGLPDGWEVAQGLDPRNPSDAVTDADGDGLTNGQEYAAGTDPRQADTDRDGLPDGWEVAHTLNPLNGEGQQGAAGDPDGDGLSNAEEYAATTDPQTPNPEVFDPQPVEQGPTTGSETPTGANLSTGQTMRLYLPLVRH